MTAASPSPTTQMGTGDGAKQGSVGGTRGGCALAQAPEAVVVGVVAVALAAGIMVSLGQHRPWTTLPLAGLIGWALWRAVRPLSPAIGARDRRGAVIVLVGVGAWIALNAIGAATYYIVSRDPGFLTLSGLWLVDHPSTDIPTLGAIEAAATQGNMLADAAQAWNLRGDMIQPQGAKMLPAVISVGGWFAGTSGVLAANLVVGGAGLLALYAVGRRFLGPLWALLPAGIVGLSVAHIGLSRSPYSEPLTLLLVIASLAWAWRGVEERRVGAIAAAGAALGAVALVRIDGAAFAAGGLAAIVLTLALTATGKDADARAWRVRAALAFAATQVTFLVAGYLSLWRWSEAYLERLLPEAKLVCLAYAAALAVALVWVATWNRAMRGERLATAIAGSLGRRGAIVAGSLVSGALVVLASRPLWTTVHRGTTSDVDTFTNRVVGYFQEAQGLPVEPTRTYAEHTVTWLALYLTWPVVVLAIAGFGIATYLALRHRPAWMLLVVGSLLPSMLYLLKPEIVPDQIWAIRRFESAAIPAFAIAASLAAMWGARWLAPRLKQPWRHRVPVLTGATLLALVLSTWISIIPTASYPVSVAMHVFTREQNGARAQVEALCAIEPGRPIVLYGTSSHFGTLRTVCDVPVVLALGDPTPDSLRDMTAVWGVAPVVLTRNPDDLVWTSPPEVVVQATVGQAEYRLQGIPREVSLSNYSWYAGVMNEDGELEPVPPGAHDDQLSQTTITDGTPNP